MTIPNMVPTVRTRLLAARLIEACERADTTGTDAVHQYLFACKKGQEVALVAAILDHKAGATPPGPDLYDDGTKPNLEAERIADQIREQLHADEGENDVDE